MSDDQEIEQYKREAAAAKRIVWAIVKEMGGRLEVPASRLLESAGSIKTWTDPETNSFIIEAE